MTFSAVSAVEGTLRFDFGNAGLSVLLRLCCAWFKEAAPSNSGQFENDTRAARKGANAIFRLKAVSD